MRGGATNERDFNYDRFGNGWVTNNTGFPLTTATPQGVTNPYDVTTNRLPGAYDDSGNLLVYQGSTFLYDGENRQALDTDPSSLGGGQMLYLYDGNGNRVAKEVQDGAATVYVYDAQNQLAAEYASTLAASLPCQTCYPSVDHLGSTRLLTDGGANVIARHDYLPFGEEIAAGTAGRLAPWGAPDGVNQKFTGKVRDGDTVPNLDYFGARYYSGALGRWTSPDSVNLTNERLLSPSTTLNKYAYGANNPLKYIDPDGKDVVAYYDHGGIAGHFMLLAYNQNTGDFAVKDYGPAHAGGDTGDRLIELAGGPISGIDGYSIRNMSADDLRQNYSSLTIQTTPELAQQVIDRIRASYGNTPKNFNFLYGPNCTTACADALKKLGIRHNVSPAGLWSELFKRYSRYTSPTFAFNYGVGTTYPHENGVDYGWQRFSTVDEFELLYKLLNPPQGCVTASDSASGTTFGGCN